jgi:hypothetical protein
MAMLAIDVGDAGLELLTPVDKHDWTFRRDSALPENAHSPLRRRYGF